MVAISTLTWSRYDTISLEWRDTTIHQTLVRTERCGFNSFSVSYAGALCLRARRRARVSGAAESVSERNR